MTADTAPRVRRGWILTVGIFLILTSLFQFFIFHRAVDSGLADEVELPMFLKFHRNYYWMMFSCLLGFLGGIGILTRWRIGWFLAVSFVIIEIAGYFLTSIAIFLPDYPNQQASFVLVFGVAIRFAILLFFLSQSTKTHFLAR